MFTFIYKKIIRPIFFLIDPERIHHWAVWWLNLISRIGLLRFLIEKICFISDSRLQVSLGSLKLENPVGLPAGFDKNVEAPLAYSMLGFGFVEFGSVTSRKQPGNPRPRLWRIPKDQGLIVYYGLSSEGADKILAKLKKIKKHPIPFGLSIAPTTGLELEDMAQDYLKTFIKVYSYVDYITLNVSCPNVANCEVFAQVSFIGELLGKLRKLMDEKNIQKNIFVKIGPHFTDQELDEVIKFCLANKITGIVATNLVKNRSGINFKSSKEELDHSGGVSGRFMAEKSNQVISYIYKKSQGQLQIIGVGGIYTALDAYKKIKAGATAVQLVTGFIYEGPLAIRNINKGLAELLEKDGFKNIGEAVGQS